DAMQLLPEASAAWYGALTRAALSGARLGRLDELARYADTLLALEARPETAGARAVACCRLASQAFMTGDKDRREELLGQLAHPLLSGASADPAISAWIANARAWERLFAGDLAASLAHDAASGDFFELAGDLRMACFQRASVGYELIQLGDYEAAE